MDDKLNELDTLKTYGKEGEGLIINLYAEILKA
jgi:hypothetical protein